MLVLLYRVVTSTAHSLGFASLMLRRCRSSSTLPDVGSPHAPSAARRALLSIRSTSAAWTSPAVRHTTHLVRLSWCIEVDTALAIARYGNQLQHHHLVASGWFEGRHFHCGCLVGLGRRTHAPCTATLISLPDLREKSMSPSLLPPSTPAFNRSSSRGRLSPPRVVFRLVLELRMPCKRRWERGRESVW